MLKKELIEKSPIRVLEKSIHGGLGKGNIGVFAARKGVGKTACLVHVATDKLLKGEKVLHVSFADDPDHIRNWYKQVFHEVAKAYKLEDAFNVYDEIIPQRLLLHFKQKDIDVAQVHDKIDRFLENTSFQPTLLIVDGFQFDQARLEEMALWKSYVEKKEIEIWFSATLHREKLQLDENKIPAPVNRFNDYLSVIIMLKPHPDYIEFELLKAHDKKDLQKLRLKLDAKTLLISNRRV